MTADQEFGQLVLAAQPAEPPTWFGLEHEYSLFSGHTKVPFPRLIGTLGFGVAQLDPADGNAHRLQSGAVLTVDGDEAEIALPPLAVGPGLGREVARRSAVERRALARRLAERHRLEGYSTHFSVAVRPDVLDKVARVYAAHFAPAVMLMLDRSTSPGLLIRPRGARLELAGEYATGTGLEAAAVFALGSVLAATTGADLPPALQGRVDPAVIRPGWYVDRRAFGTDLYATGRRALLPTAAGSITAQEHLEAAWAIGRESLLAHLDPTDLVATDQMVRGDLPLPMEQPLEAEPAYEFAGPRSEWGAILGPRHRRGFALAPVLVSWNLCVFIVANRRKRRGFAAVPGPMLKAFVHLLDSGALDDVVAAYLAEPRTGRLLAAPEHAAGPGLFDELGPRVALLRAA